MRRRMRTDGSGMYLLLPCWWCHYEVEQRCRGNPLHMGGGENFKRVEEGTRSMILQSEDVDANIRVRGDEW